MSVVLFREIWPGRQSEFVYSYIPADTTDRVFMVRTNNRGDDATVITAYTGPIVSPYGETGAPQLGYTHPNNELQFIQRVRLRQHDQSPIEWYYTCEYSDAPVKPPQDINPLLRPAIIVGTSQRGTKSTITDYQGNWIVNSAGTLYDPQEIPYSNFGWSVSKNVNINSIPSFILTIPLATNSDSWTLPQLGLIFPAKTLLVSDFGHSDIKCEQVGASQVLYRTFTFVLSYDQNTWVNKPVDRGWMAIPLGSGGPYKPYEILVPSNLGGNSSQTAPGPLVKPSRPQFLDGAGHYVLGNPPIEWPTNGYDMFGTFDFTQLTAYCQ